MCLLRVERGDWGGIWDGSLKFMLDPGRVRQEPGLRSYLLCRVHASLRS